LRAAKAGAFYFAAVFALGFALGTLRVGVLEPRFGRLAALALELPVMLAASWVACRALVARLRIPPAAADRLVMGGTAFALLMGAELLVGMLAFDRTFASHLATYREPLVLVGLAGQVLFALFPLAQAWLMPDDTGGRK
jgi:hypothetical protein